MWEKNSVKFDELSYHKRQFSKIKIFLQRDFIKIQGSKFCAVANQFFVSPEKLAKYGACDILAGK